MRVLVKPGLFFPALGRIETRTGRPRHARISANGVRVIVDHPGHRSPVGAGELPCDQRPAAAVAVDAAHESLVLRRRRRTALGSLRRRTPRRAVGRTRCRSGPRPAQVFQPTAIHLREPADKARPFLAQPRHRSAAGQTGTGTLEIRKIYFLGRRRQRHANQKAKTQQTTHHLINSMPLKLSVAWASPSAQ